MRIRAAIISFAFLFFVISLGVVSAQYLGTETDPPRLRDLEPIVVQMIYVVWGLGTLLLTLILMWRGVQYMLSMGSPEKQQEVRQGSTNWLYSLLVFFLAYPVILGVYNVTGIGGSTSDCYKDISTPGFKFFFPTVCTDPQAGSDKYGVGGDCSGFSVEEFNNINESRCCLGSNLIVPTGEEIGMVKSASGTVESGVVYQNNAGKCGQVSTCSVVATDPNACEGLPFLEYTYNQLTGELTITD